MSVQSGCNSEFYSKKKIKPLIRSLALLLILGAMKTTPTNGIEAKLSVPVPSLFLVIESEAIMEIFS